MLAGRLHGPAILDGEIVALRAGLPDFGRLQSRMHVRRPSARLVEGAPVQLYLFDRYINSPTATPDRLLRRRHPRPLPGLGRVSC